MRLIDADDFRYRMYHESFERGSEEQRWDSGCWIRYRMFERVLDHQPTAKQWIPCSERLPGEENPFYVLCCDKHGEIMIGHVFKCNDGETPYSAESEHEYMYDCVAWMPLPASYRGVK